MASDHPRGQKWPKKGLGVVLSPIWGWFYTHDQQHQALTNALFQGVTQHAAGISQRDWHVLSIKCYPCGPFDFEHVEFHMGKNPFPVCHVHLGTTQDTQVGKTSRDHRLIKGLGSSPIGVVWRSRVFGGGRLFGLLGARR